MKRLIALFVSFLFAASLIAAAGCSKKEEPTKPPAPVVKPAEPPKPPAPEKKSEEVKPGEAPKLTEKAPEKK
jgi:hypothetical protein